MTRDEWTALAERCEKADARQDRTLDDDILTALGFQGGGVSDDGSSEWYRASDDTYACCVSISIDAIMALIGRDLPEWGVTLVYEAVDFRPEHKPYAALWGPGVAGEDGTKYLMTNGRGSTLAHALRAAFCRAMGSRANG